MYWSGIRMVGLVHKTWHINRPFEILTSKRSVFKWSVFRSPLYFLITKLVFTQTTSTFKVILERHHFNIQGGLEYWAFKIRTFLCSDFQWEKSKWWLFCSVFYWSGPFENRSFKMAVCGPLKNPKKLLTIQKSERHSKSEHVRNLSPHYVLKIFLSGHMLNFLLK